MEWEASFRPQGWGGTDPIIKFHDLSSHLFLAFANFPRRDPLQKEEVRTQSGPHKGIPTQGPLSCCWRSWLRSARVSSKPLCPVPSPARAHKALGPGADCPRLPSVSPAGGSQAWSISLLGDCSFSASVKPTALKGTAAHHYSLYEPGPHRLLYFSPGVRTPQP